MFNVDGIDNETIKSVVTELVKHHDMLRCVRRDGVLKILPIAESKLFDFYGFDYSKESDKYKAVTDKCSEIQASIDLENGPVVKVAVFELGDAKRMMISVHHFAIDGVSWRILCEDFETAVEQLADGKDIILPEKTASFIEWSRKLREYGKQMDDEKRRFFSKIKCSIPDGNVKWNGGSSDMGSVSVEFNEKVTDDLLKKCSGSYGAKVNEIMLAALAKAVNAITGQEKLAVRLEGHGREEIHEPVAIDRTVGWFTNVYAVNLDCTGDDEKLIVSAKDTVRAVPNSGIGYAYADAGEETIPDICFNYLGDFSQNDGMMAYDYSCGNDISEKNILPDKVSINANVGDGKLIVEFTSFSHDLGRSFIECLAEEYRNTLTELIDHCCESKDTVQTASDMSISYIADNDISFINSLID